MIDFFNILETPFALKTTFLTTKSAFRSMNNSVSSYVNKSAVSRKSLFDLQVMKVILTFKIISITIHVLHPIVNGCTNCLRIYH